MNSDLFHSFLYLNIPVYPYRAYKNVYQVKFQVLTVASMKLIAFRDIVPRSLVVVADLSEVRTASIIAIMMEAVRTSETSVYYESTRRCIPEGYHLQRFNNVALAVISSLQFAMYGSPYTHALRSAS
jgi:hypothetical protein